MSLHNIDNYIIIFFIVITLCCAMFSSRGVRTAKEYAIGNNLYSNITMIIALFASVIGGHATVGNLAELYKHGMIYSIIFIGFVVAAYLMAKYVAPRFDDRFKGMLSSCDIIAQFYGKEAEVFASIVGVLWGAIKLGVHIMILGIFLSGFLKIKYEICVVSATLIALLSTIGGGIKSVTFTDKIQFFILSAAFIILAVFCMIKLDASLISEIPEGHKSIISHDKFNQYMYVAIYYCMPFTLLTPPVVQRFLMSKDRSQIIKMMHVYNIMTVVLMVLLGCIALYSLTHFVHVNPKFIMIYVADEVLPPIARGIVASGMISVVLSSADSYLHSSASLLALNTFFDRKRSDAEQLRLIKIITVILSIFGMCIALMKLVIFKIVMFLNILMTGVTVSLFMVIMGVKVQQNNFWYANICGVITFYISIIFLDLKICVLINAIAVILGFVASYLWNQLLNQKVKA